MFSAGMRSIREHQSHVVCDYKLTVYIVMEMDALFFAIGLKKAVAISFTRIGVTLLVHVRSNRIDHM